MKPLSPQPICCGRGAFAVRPPCRKNEASWQRIFGRRSLRNTYSLLYFRGAPLSVGRGVPQEVGQRRGATTASRGASSHSRVAPATRAAAGEAEQGLHHQMGMRPGSGRKVAGRSWHLQGQIPAYAGNPLPPSGGHAPPFAVVRSEAEGVVGFSGAAHHPARLRGHPSSFEEGKDSECDADDRCRLINRLGVTAEALVGAGGCIL
jgi:hypothetical protein